MPVSELSAAWMNDCLEAGPEKVAKLRLEGCAFKGCRHLGGPACWALSLGRLDLAKSFASEGLWGSSKAQGQWRSFWLSAALLAPKAKGQSASLAELEALWRERWGASRLDWRLPCFKLLALGACALAVAAPSKGSLARQAQRCLGALGSSAQGSGIQACAESDAIAEGLCGLGAAPKKSFIQAQLDSGRWSAAVWAWTKAGLSASMRAQPHWSLCARLVGDKGKIESLGMGAALELARQAKGLDSWDPLAGAGHWSQAFFDAGADPAKPAQAGRSAIDAMRRFMRGQADFGADPGLASLARLRMGPLWEALRARSERESLEREVRRATASARSKRRL